MGLSTARRLACPAALVVALIAAGCGSSGSATTATGTGTSTSGGAGGGATTGGHLKATTTPNYGAPAAGTPVQSGLVQVAYRNITIEPDAIRVKVGSTVRWMNHDPIDHNVTSEGGPQQFASKDLGPGGTFEIKLTKPGVIHYECTIHPASMNGTIEVVS